MSSAKSDGQSYVAWFTTYPITHEKAGQTVEVVTREWAESTISYALNGYTRSPPKHEQIAGLQRERDSAQKLYLSAGEGRDKAEAEVERLHEVLAKIAGMSTEALCADARNLARDITAHLSDSERGS